MTSDVLALAETLDLPSLPSARGPLPAAVLGAVRGDVLAIDPARAHPYGRDLQLALHLCYELHYRGFDGMDEDLEWDPGLLSRPGPCLARSHQGVAAEIFQVVADLCPWKT